MKNSIKIILKSSFVGILFLVLVGHCLAVQSNKSEITIGLSSQPAMLDQHLITANNDLYVTNAINETFLTYDEDMNIVGGVAENWEFDGTTLEFKIRENMYFHNGRQVTAEDVKFSIERVMDETTGSPYRKDYSLVKEVEVIDKLNGIIHLVEPFGPLENKLLWLPIIPKEAVDTLRTEPIGCGPYKFVEWRSDQYIKLEKYEKWWDEGERADVIIFRFFPEYSTGRAALLSEDIDVLTNMLAIDIPIVEKRDDLKFEGVLGRMSYVGFNVTVPPYDDIRVRRAIAYTINRKSMVNAILRGYGETAYVVLVKDNFFYDESFNEPYPRDVKKAKELLEEAGYSNGFEDTLYVRSGNEALAGEMLQAQLSEIGINLRIEKLEGATFVERIYNNHDFGIMIAGGGLHPEPDNVLYRVWYTDGPSNRHHYSNSEVDRLLDQGRKETVPDKRKEIYKKIFHILIDEVPYIPILLEKNFLVMNSNIYGLLVTLENRFKYYDIHME